MARSGGHTNDSQEATEMARQTRAAQKQAVEKRTQERLAARKEAAQRGAETKRRKREEAAQGAPTPEAASQAAGGRTEAAQPNVARQEAASDRGPMVTVALRGESAARLRALAAAQEMSLSKLLVRMMDLLEAQAG